MAFASTASLSLNEAPQFAGIYFFGKKTKKKTNMPVLCHSLPDDWMFAVIRNDVMLFLVVCFYMIPQY